MLEAALHDPQLQLRPEEIGTLHLEIGKLYHKLQQYDRAVEQFETMFRKFDQEKYRYTPEFLLVLQTYRQAGQRERALEIYQNLLARQSYDRQFKKIRKAERWF